MIETDIFVPGSADKIHVSASKLAQMGICEQLVQFEYRYGRRLSARQRADMARGNREHARFFLESQAAHKGRCFIATQVYGEPS
jgi:hypothetical protein